MELTENAGTDKYGHTGYGIEFSTRSDFLWSNGSSSKNKTISTVNMRLIYPH